MNLRRSGNKYGNIKATVGEHTFDSTREAHRYGELLLLQSAGVIRGLGLQPRYVLQEAFRANDGQWQRAITYIGDFGYYEIATKRFVVEDVKGGRGTITQAWKIKAKLFKKQYPHIELRVVGVS